MKEFVEKMIDEAREQNMKEHTFRLARNFAKYGKTHKNVTRYNKLYSQLVNRVKGVAAKVGRKKYGYMSSSDLCIAGRYLLVYKQLLDCKKGELHQQCHL